MLDANSIQGQAVGENARQEWININTLNGETINVHSMTCKTFKNKKDESFKTFLIEAELPEDHTKLVISASAPKGATRLANFQFVAELCKLSGGLGNVLIVIDEFEVEGGGTAKAAWLCNSRGERLLGK